MDTLTITAEKREITGKKTKQLRNQGLIPAVISTPELKSDNIQISAKEFAKVYAEAGHSTLVDVHFGSKKFKVLIEEVQVSPSTRQISHAMFKKVDLKEEIHAEVPVELVGEAPAVKVEKAILVTPVDTIEIKCLPTDLPQFIEVDVTKLEQIGDSITVADITLPKGVKLVREEDNEEVLVTATAPQLEVEETETQVSPEDVELSVEKGKKETTEE